jgi:hypothetical protein
VRRLDDAQHPLDALHLILGPGKTFAHFGLSLVGHRDLVEAPDTALLATADRGRG